MKQMLMNTFFSKKGEVRILGKEELEQLYRSLSTLSSNEMRWLGWARMR
jgi:hypothetical protein